MTGAELADELSTIADAYCADTREAWRMARFVNANMVAILAALRAERPEPAVGDVDAVNVADAMVEAALDAQQVYWKPQWRDDPFAPERKEDMRKAISAALLGDTLKAFSTCLHHIEKPLLLRKIGYFGSAVTLNPLPFGSRLIKYGLL